MGNRGSANESLVSELNYSVGFSAPSQTFRVLVLHFPLWMGRWSLTCDQASFFSGERESVAARYFRVSSLLPTADFRAATLSRSPKKRTPDRRLLELLFENPRGKTKKNIEYEPRVVSSAGASSPVLDFFFFLL